MHFPEDLLYTNDHEWVKVDGDIAVVGVTDYAQKELGDIVYIDISTLSETLEQHEIFGTIEAVKAVSDLFMPVSGTIIEVNPALEAGDDGSEHIVNKDPYGKGWMIKVKLDAPLPDNLLNAADYRKMVG
ncbi:MAG: glycine cleavage system protein GcvH [Bacteroidia bacterium]|nr:glycine cleavage system protein GcvH [Bacteroidia bacterium]